MDRTVRLPELPIAWLRSAVIWCCGLSAILAGQPLPL
jgi:hypothetical protein